MPLVPIASDCRKFLKEFPGPHVQHASEKAIELQIFLLEERRTSCKLETTPDSWKPHLSDIFCYLTLGMYITQGLQETAVQPFVHLH